MADHLASALGTLSIPAETYQKHPAFEALPQTRDDPAWNNFLNSPYNLTILEVGALKNARCGSTQQSVGHGLLHSLIVRIKIENEANGRTISEKVLVDGGCEVTPLLLNYSDIEALDLVPSPYQITARLGDHSTVRKMTEYSLVKVTLVFNDGEEVCTRLNPACFMSSEPNTASQVIVAEYARILGYTALRSLGLKEDYKNRCLVKVIRRL